MPTTDCKLSRILVLNYIIYNNITPVNTIIFYIRYNSQDLLLNSFTLENKFNFTTSFNNTLDFQPYAYVIKTT